MFKYTCKSHSMIMQFMQTFVPHLVSGIFDLRLHDTFCRDWLEEEEKREMIELSRMKNIIINITWPSLNNIFFMMQSSLQTLKRQNIHAFNVELFYGFAVTLFAMKICFCRLEKCIELETAVCSFKRKMKREKE